MFPQFRDRTFIFKVSNHDPWPWLAEHGGDRAKLQAWGSVLTTAFDVALRAGCNPIVFAGADLAYTDGLQYCRNTVYEPDWSPFPTNDERAAEFAKFLQTRPHVSHRDLNGRDVTTAPHFIQFRDWIVAQAETAAPRRVINATGAGILHGGGIALAGLDTLKFTALKDDPRARLNSAWSTSTASTATVRDQVTRAAAYGALIPVQRWHEFGGNGTTVDQICATLQSAVSRLEFDRLKFDCLKGQRDSYNQRIDSLGDARELSHGNYGVAKSRATAQQTHLLLDYLQRVYVTERLDIDSVLQSMSRMPRSIRALDVGCGIGRLMEPLTEVGMLVDGVDFDCTIGFESDRHKETVVAMGEGVKPIFYPLNELRAHG